MLHVCLSDNYFSISFQDDSTKSSYRRSLSAGSFVSSGRIFQLFLITGFPVPSFLSPFSGGGRRLGLIRQDLEYQVPKHDN